MPNRNARAVVLCLASALVLTCVASAGVSIVAGGSIALSAASYEVAAGAASITITVNRVGGSAGAVVATYSTADGSAVAGTDYQSSGGIVSWSDGDDAPKSFAVVILPGSPGNDSFTVSLLSSSGASLGPPTSAPVIIQPPAALASPGEVQFSTASFEVSRDDAAASISVERVGGASGQAVVTYGTADYGGIAGVDYVETSGTLTWSDGDASPRSFSVPLVAGAQGSANFIVALRSAFGAGFGTPYRAVVQIAAGSGDGSGTSGGGPAPPGPLGTTAGLLSYLNGLSGQSKHILVGQHSAYWDSNPMDVVTSIPAQAGGKQVAILGVTNDQIGSTEDVVGLSNTWLAQNGIVLMSQWPHNPLRAVGSTNFADVVTPGTEAYNAWYSYLDAQIVKLKQIQGPVLWRPFVELNGPWSWWVPSEGSQQAVFVKLWQQTHDYVIAQGVTNVLWLFNLNTSDSSGGSAWYPGDGYVDVVSLDAYPPSTQYDTPVYNFLVSTGKPLLYAEAGVFSANNSAVAQQTYDTSALLATLKSNFPKAVGLVIFCQNYAIPLQNGASTLMNDPAAVTLADLPTSQ